MRGELVALDLETTGLDIQTDAIIEVGIVRIKEGKIIDTFSTMVNPESPIPEHITHITGIHHNDVLNAPTIRQILPKIAAFIGDSPVIAHNISLDMGFLRDRYGILKRNIQLDTYDLASILLPTAPRYNLNSLTQQVGIKLENAHRALDDARAAALLYWELWQKILTMPQSLLEEISHAAEGLDWDTATVFSAALQENRTSSSDLNPIEFEAYNDNSEPLIPNSTQPLKTQAIDDILGENGTLAHQLSNFEYRPQQLEMAHGIVKAFNHAHHLMVEAGTGTGKSLAYLIPAILWAVQNNERVVISTNTLNLQDQLINKDIPLLREKLGLNFKASVMKGRNNYLCPRRIAAVRRRKPSSILELKTLAKILVWMQESQSGDKGEISLRGPAEHGIWVRMSAQDEGCTLNQCENMMQGVCPFYKARKSAESAHVLIVNHALLISDAKAENNVLPEYRYLIVDEAHQLEDAITNGMSVHIDQSSIIRRLIDLGGANRGLLGEIIANTKTVIFGKEITRLEAFIQGIGEALILMEMHVKQLFNALHDFINELRPNRSTDYITLVRIEPSHRDKGSFAHIQSVWKTLDEFYEVISDAMKELSKAFNRLEEQNIPRLNELKSSVISAAEYLQESRVQLNSFIATPQENMVYWLGLAQGTTSPVVHLAPLHIGPMVEQYLWRTKQSVIMTSATLRAHDNFDYIRDRLYAEDVHTLEVGSPFNYQDSTLIYIPTDIPDPTDRKRYQHAVERGIVELAAALDGRVMVLFTSYTQLRQTSQAITPRLALGNISVFDQSDGTSRQALLDGFKSTEKAVLLGTKSFWEGVDVPGDSLSGLIITRLPFAVPSDPVFASRAETYKNSFQQYNLPDAILRFRQGFGRLIRSKTDRGIVTIFDSRIINKAYGANFLEALPNCTVQQGSLDSLANVAKNWVNKG